MTPRLGLLVCSVALAAPAAAEPCHVIIMAGQSNMVGNFGLDQLVFEGFDYAQPQPAVLYDYHVQGVERAIGLGALMPHTEVPNTTYGPELALGRHLDVNGLEVQYAVVKVAVGGSNLASRWDPDNQGDLYDRLIDQLVLSMSELELMGFTPQVTGFGWLQGDGDLWVPEWTYAYEANLHELVDEIRLDLAAPQMHAMIVQTPLEHNKPDDLVAVMRQAKADFCANDPHASLIDTDDLSFYDNNIHIDGTGRLTIGRRMAEAYLADSVFGTPCPADMDANGELNLDDLMLFIAAFVAHDPLADLNGDGEHNIDDLDAFSEAFTAGC